MTILPELRRQAREAMDKGIYLVPVELYNAVIGIAEAEQKRAQRYRGALDKTEKALQLLAYTSAGHDKSLSKLMATMAGELQHVLRDEPPQAQKEGEFECGWNEEPTKTRVPLPITQADR